MSDLSGYEFFVTLATVCPLSCFESDAWPGHLAWPLTHACLCVLLMSDLSGRLAWPCLALTHTCSCVPLRCAKKNKLFLNVQINGNGCEDSPSRSPLLSARTPGATPATAPYTLPGTPTLLEEHSGLKSKCPHITLASLPMFRTA